MGNIQRGNLKGEWGESEKTQIFPNLNFQAKQSWPRLSEPGKTCEEHSNEINLNYTSYKLVLVSQSTGTVIHISIFNVLPDKLVS